MPTPYKRQRAVTYTKTCIFLKKKKKYLKLLAGPANLFLYAVAASD